MREVARAVEEGAGHFAQRVLASDLHLQLLREPRLRQRPDVGEPRLVEHVLRDDFHRALQLVERARQPRAVGQLRGRAQIAGRHLPLAPQHPEHGARPRRKALGLGPARDAPERVEMRHEAARDEERAALRELGVVDAPAPHHLVLRHPRQTALRVFLDVARHVRVAPAADGDVERSAGPPRVRHRGAEPGALHEPLGPGRVLHARLRLARPHQIAVSLDLLGQEPRLGHPLSRRRTNHHQPPPAASNLPD
ncbi:MAG: hypothetical protein LC800_06385 [Acidobacteria bacterium]|nr:hypothetical protein [Acidobacteriota bacterium]